MMVDQTNGNLGRLPVAILVGHHIEANFRTWRGTHEDSGNGRFDRSRQPKGCGRPRSRSVPSTTAPAAGGQQWSFSQWGCGTEAGGIRQRRNADLASQSKALRPDVVPNDQINLQVLLSTDARRKAWEALPDTFSYTEAEQLIV